jgi:undecaprenyl-diphosphatase
MAFNKFIQKYAEKLPFGVLFPLGLFMAAIYLFSDITYNIIWKQEVETDLAIFKFLSEHVINPPLTEFMKRFTHLASGPFLQGCYIALMLLYALRKNYRRVIEIFAIALSGTLLNLAMKISFHRLRPPDPLIEPLKSFSYPSGHANSGFIFYGLLCYLIWKSNFPHPYKTICCSVLLILALAVGFSRVYLRVHYPSDVLAGFTIGFAWLLLLIWIMEKLKSKATKEVVQEIVEENIQNKEDGN